MYSCLLFPMPRHKVEAAPKLSSFYNPHPNYFVYLCKLYYIITK